MDSNLTRLTVLFEAPFWVGIFERIEGNTLSVCKVTFGAEPKDYEVLAYVLKKPQPSAVQSVCCRGHPAGRGKSEADAAPDPEADRRRHSRHPVTAGAAAAARGAEA